MRNDFDLLVFDWDGTLMDSVASIVACMQQAADDLGFGPVPEESVRRMIGLGLIEAREAVGLPVSEETWLEVIERYRHHWLATYKDQNLLFPGAAPMLGELAAAGYVLAVATGKGRRGLDRDLDATGVRGLFAATRTVDESPSKPHPAMLLELMDELGATPRRTLMIGDTPYDLQMATNAGAGSVAVTSGTHGAQELTRFGPLACLPSVVALPSWLAGPREEGS
ncbi:MAG TPA: HAD-IA family hydrolase [Thermoanaerobaculia bacterium]|nr:HAD-IA family hydrolase [Thermoanaerobaculia bacterium]